MISHEPVRHSVEQPAKLVCKLHRGSHQLKPVHFYGMTSDHMVTGESGIFEVPLAQLDRATVFGYRRLQARETGVER
jgi:hypothetical protein